MIKFFRHIRQNMINQNRTKKYMLYAIGEIILVVIGILIALQVNNWNIDKANKKQEQKFLANIVLDLNKDIKKLNELIAFRESRLIGDRKIIEHCNGKPVEDLNEMSKNVINAMMERNFSPNNTTFLELSNSGNLNLISNDSIKFLLLELDELYKENALAIEHETYDYREYISKPSNTSVNVDQLIPIFTGAKTAEEQQITLDSFDMLLATKSYKNGLYIMTFLSDAYITSYTSIKDKSEVIITLIKGSQ